MCIVQQLRSRYRLYRALHGRLAGRCNDFAPSRQKKCHRQKQPSRPGPRKKKNTAPSRPASEKKNNRPVPPRKKKKNAPSRHEQQNTPPRGWKLETNTTACLSFSLSCCTFISYCSLVRSIFLFLVFGWWSLSHADTNTPPLSLCLAVMDAYLNPQPNSGAGQPPQAGAAEVPSPSQQQQQQQPAPSGTSDVAGAGAGKHAKKKYNRPVPPREKKTTAPSRLGEKKRPPRPASKKKTTVPSRQEFPPLYFSSPALPPK